MAPTSTRRVVDPAAAAKERFDRLHGAELLAQVPTSPGVYRWLAEDGSVLYVGKAKNLRRRLSQYRAARRTKKGRKMWRLVGLAARVEWTALGSELEACLEEVRLIQALRPPENVASAFEFLYPMIGVSPRAAHARLCLTTLPDRFPEYAMHGAYRSRETTGAAFFALMRLLEFVAHTLPRRELGEEADVEHSYVFGFRRLGAAWVARVEAFLRGDDPGLMAELSLALIERPSARARAGDVQADLRLLRDFWRDEVRPLREAVTTDGFAVWPVPQAARDPLFLRFRATG